MRSSFPLNTALHREYVMVKQSKMTGVFPFLSWGGQCILRNVPMYNRTLRATSPLLQKFDVPLLLVPVDFYKCCTLRHTYEDYARSIRERAWHSCLELVITSLERVITSLARQGRY